MAITRRKKKLPSGTLKIKSLKSLRRCLGTYRVDYSEWGTGYTKTIRELMKEIRLGESVLIVKRGVLIRQVRHSQADITFDADGKLLRLYEIQQIFSNGAIRHRDDTSRSVSEKIMRGESRRAAMIRGIREELGLTGYCGEGLKTVEPHRRTRRKDSAVSYPGLAVEHIEFQFTWKMPAEHYAPKGYVEEKKRKTTYFEWREVEPVPEKQAA